MANPLILLRRIKTAENVKKTTKAMQMISTAKLKQAQEATLASRPYVNKLKTITRDLKKYLDKESLPPYMRESNETGRTLHVIISPDKGLCGGLVINLAKKLLRPEFKEDPIITVGTKIEGIVSAANLNLIASFPLGTTLPSYDMINPIVKIIDSQFLTGKVDKVEIISTHFKNIFFQKPHTAHLLPIRPLEDDPEANEKPLNTYQLFVPNPQRILHDIIDRFVDMVIHQEILESYLAEQAARMISMQNATKNAEEMIEDLRLEYNKSRQAKITSEILDIATPVAM